MFALIQQDLPIRLHQFHEAVESNAVVLKRLYLVKCEYRAPFRVFLEAHQTIQRAPSLDLVMEQCRLRSSNNNNNNKRADGKKTAVTSSSERRKEEGKETAAGPAGEEQKKQEEEEEELDLQKLLEKPELVEALLMEQELESLEKKMAEALLGFTELARLLEQKRARLRAVPGLLESNDILPMNKLLTVSKSIIMCVVQL